MVAGTRLLTGPSTVFFTASACQSDGWSEGGRVCVCQRAHVLMCGCKQVLGLRRVLMVMHATKCVGHKEPKLSPD